jgi:hypothetical protein
MATAHTASGCNPLDYLTAEELARLNEVFDNALRDATCLVFWTGVGFERAQSWATQQGLKTLTLTMGPLYHSHEADGARFGKSDKAWSKYMKGASARFAEYACLGDRWAIVLTKPPPNVYSTRGPRSNYLQLEEPILKGAAGGPGTTRIEYVHPTVKGATDFRYQIWPQNTSKTWAKIVETLSAASIAVEHSVAAVSSGKDECELVVQQIKVVVSHKAHAGMAKIKQKAKSTNREGKDQAKYKQKLAESQLKSAKEKIERKERKTSSSAEELRRGKKLNGRKPSWNSGELWRRDERTKNERS